MDNFSSRASREVCMVSARLDSSNIHTLYVVEAASARAFVKLVLTLVKIPDESFSVKQDIDDEADGTRCALARLKC